MLRPLVVLALLLAAALAGAGLTFSRTYQAPAQFRFVNGSEPRTLDPARLTGQPGQRVVDALFEGLTRRDARSLAPAPGMAERWEVSDDGRTWTFHLREAHWSDGQPVTADDFAYAWRRVLEPATGAEYAYLLHGLRHARALNTHDAEADAIGAALPREGRARAEGLRTVAELRRSAAEARRRFGVDAGAFARDPRTLVVELEAPVAYFLELTSFFTTRPVPRWLVERRPRDWFLPRHLVSNGPFRLASWRVNDRMRLERSETYWDRDAVALESADVLALEQPTTALNLYLTGDVDWLPSLYPDDLVDVLRERADFYSGPGMIVYYYRLNTRRPPLDDPRVRRAIGLAIDREQITRDVLGLGQIPATTLVPPGMPGYEPPASGLGFDPERARALLAEAGFPGGRGLRELGLLYNTHETHKKVAEVIADQLRRHLGLRVQAYNQEWQSYLSSVRSGDYDVARAGWIGDYLDPNTFLDIWVSGGGNNQTGWGDARYDTLIAAAADVAVARRAPAALLAAAPEPARLREGLAAAARAPASAAARRAANARLRFELLRQAEARLVQQGFPVIPIYFYVVSGLVKPHVAGFHSELELPDGSRAANLMDLHPLRDISLRREGD